MRVRNVCIGEAQIGDQGCGNGLAVWDKCTTQRCRCEHRTCHKN